LVWAGLNALLPESISYVLLQWVGDTPFWVGPQLGLAQLGPMLGPLRGSPLSNMGGVMRCHVGFDSWLDKPSEWDARSVCCKD
jgi:hypothetical protein